MKILLINQEHALFGGPGGAERSVQSIADYMAGSGHQVTFVSMARKIYTRDMDESGIHSVRDVNGVKTILVGKKSSMPTHSDLLAPIILQEQPDVVHTNVFHRAPQLWERLSRLGVPLIHTLREYKLMCDRNMFNGVADCGSQCVDCSAASNYAVRMSQHVDGVIGISAFTLDRHLGRGFFSSAAIKKVIPNSYEPRRRGPPKEVREAGVRLRVGYLGRLHASKGINLVIDAFSRLSPQVASLIMAGDLQDSSISERIESLGATHDAQYIGFVDPVDFFSRIDVLVAPSIWHEPFGRIAIEAFAHRVPVIATRRGGLQDIVEHGITGWLFDPERVDDLASIINNLAGCSSTELEALSTAAFEASKRYRPPVVGNMYLSAYEEVIEDRRSRSSASQTAFFKFYSLDARRQNISETMKAKVPPRERRPLKVMIVVGEFPKLSETFVLNHVTGLIDLGVDARVLFTRRGSPAETPIDYLKYGLEERSISTLPPDTMLRPLRSVASDARNVGSRLAAALKAGSLNDERLESTLDKARETLDTMQQQLIDVHAAQTLARNLDGVDVIHCHFGHRPKTIFKYLDMIGAKIPVVCAYHGIDMSAHIKSMGPSLYDDVKSRLHKALPISDFFRRRLISLGFDPKDVQVHRVGVDCSKFLYAPRIRGFGEALRLISVGRCVYKKGFDFAIMGVAAALRRRPDIKIEYSIIGDGVEMPRLQSLVGELDMSQSVYLLGSRPHGDVTRQLAQSHAMLATSVTAPDGDMEGIPTVTMEAMATGLPVISTYHSGIPEAVVDGYSGLLAEEFDVEGLADAIIKLYDNPELGPRFGGQGRMHVLSEFNIDLQNVKVVDLYKRIAFGNLD